MIIIHNAYIYIKNQLENCKEEKEYEKMEEDFKDFWKSVENDEWGRRENWKFLGLAD